MRDSAVYDRVVRYRELRNRVILYRAVHARAYATARCATAC